MSIEKKKLSKRFKYLSYSQLNIPIGIYVSRKTGALYIADRDNNRIQRWSLGESQGVTIAGDPGGNPGKSNYLFNNTNSVALDTEEKHLFAADRNNHQIKMFELI